MLADPIAYDTTVKVNMTHNISSNKLAEVRLDLGMTIYQVKLQVQKRYGSDPAMMALILKDIQGNTLHSLRNDGASFGTYNPQDGYIIHVIDSNPYSVLKGLEDVSQVQKFQLSEEQYDQLPDNFRKFKQKIVQNQAAGNYGDGEETKDQGQLDDDFEKDLADQISIGKRCQLLGVQHRGTVRYVGQIPQMGLGYFVGIQLDEPYGANNGTLKGYSFFNCPQKYGIFLRPSEIEIGDYPEADLDDEI